MAEELTLTTPVVTPAKTSSTYRIVALLLNSEQSFAAPVPPPQVPVIEPGFVQITLRDNLGNPSSYTYGGTEALDYIKWLNTGNFTTRTMHKRILEKLVKDGKLVGTVTGAPDAPTQPPPADF